MDINFNGSHDLEVSGISSCDVAVVLECCREKIMLHCWTVVCRICLRALNVQNFSMVYSILYIFKCKVFNMQFYVVMLFQNISENALP